MTQPHKGTALITGAAQRLGRATALALASAGYDIIIHYYTSQESANSLVEEITTLGKKAHLFQSELNGQDAANAVFNEALSHADDINVLINNASTFQKADFLHTDEALLNKHLQLHVHTPLFLAQAFTLQKNEGCIINMIDTDITSNQGAYFAYLLSKKSMHSLTLMLAKELAPSIRVNALCPNSILPSEHWTQDKIDAKNQRLPLQKTPTIKEITETILHLIENKALTGQTIFVDSGQQLV